jgi:hypothetical protein
MILEEINFIWKAYIDILELFAVAKVQHPKVKEK